MDLDKYFAYSQSTASNHHLFPSKVTDVYDRVIPIKSLVEKYRVFVITIASIHHSIDFIYTLLNTLKTRIKTTSKDIRFVILCPGSKRQVLDRIHDDDDDFLFWLASPSVAQQLQLFITFERYEGSFLLEIHSSCRWQLIYHINHIKDRNDDEMNWLVRSLAYSRLDWEKRAQVIIDTTMKISFDIPFFNPMAIPSSSSPSWGWLTFPFEIQYAILQAMQIQDILACSRASPHLHHVIGPWLAYQLQTHLRSLSNYKDLPLRSLQSHERQLTWLLFQLQPVLSQ
ncbi:uncharacterized protein BX664DRAFT_389237 [Halteromyces radiatus]|uniref:uncharacterized protein n=1 Tax=Halteromyces radiatus TaxID=101107 RepID=UPI00221F9ED4|nr:uncharacterized protein BX664DRAFT_389237 [Halteromyces radiatus]KAI8078872.1 hypothetical protein BX664DRAFT_389237 [Halteromyces radiatus]